MPDIPIPHDGRDQIVYIPGGPDPTPLHLSEGDGFAELVNGRETPVLRALLQYALDQLDDGEERPTALPSTESRRVDGFIDTLKSTIRRQHDLIVQLTTGRSNA